jgi:hypothetical protein
MQTAQAQSGLNTDTALTQQLTNMVDQNNPWGSVGYSQNGTTGFTDSTGRYREIPQFTQTTTYNPEQQAIFDKTTQAQTNIAGIAQDQSAKLGQYLNTPFQFDNQDAANWAYDLAQQRIAPQQQQAQDALRTQLINSGLRPGTQAWDSEMTRLSQANNDQNNQLALTSRGQAFGEALATRNQPLNEITALLSGSQVSNPGAVSSPTPQAQVGGVDYTGLVSQNYQTEAANAGGALGGLFGLAGSLGSAGIKAGMFSDIRLKTDITRVGTLDNGLPVYAYRYKAGGPMQIGVMAQEVAQIRPEAVMIDDASGYLMVDYSTAVH